MKNIQSKIKSFFLYFSGLMHYRLFIVLLHLTVLSAAQPQFKLQPARQQPLTANIFYGADSFGNLYYSQKGTLYKKTSQQIYSFYALGLGEIQSVDLLNPLKISLFYKDFNTVIILDNQLSEIERINLNTRKVFRVAAFASTGFERNLWIFNTDLQRLELYNYAEDATRAATQPLNKKIIAQASNYNFCWLYTDKNELLQYNIYGSPTDVFYIEKGHAFQSFRDGLVYRNDNRLYFYSPRFKDVFALPEVKQAFDSFFITESALYLYHNNQLFTYPFNFSY